MNIYFNRASIGGLKKIMFLIIFAALPVVVWGQTDKIQISRPVMTIEQALIEIEDQTGYRFAVNNNDIDISKPGAVSNNATSLDEILNELLAGTGHTYRISGKYIFIVAKQSPKSKIKVEDIEYIPIRSSIRGENYVMKKNEPRFKTITNERDSLFTVLGFDYDTSRSYTLNTSGVVKMSSERRLPLFSVKTNVLYGASTLTPNLAFELRTGRRTSIELSAAYNPWNLDADDFENKKRVHTIIRPEFRYWLCETFNGHFFGVHAFYANFNVNGYKVPSLFEKKYRYEGYALGGGLTYGYQWMLSQKWGLEANVGVGVAHMKYDRYPCIHCGSRQEEKNKTYVGPTRAGITLVYIIK